MDCKTAGKYLHLYKDDELTDKEKTSLGNHLAGCTKCRALSKELKLYEEALKEIVDQEPTLSNPDQLTGNIMSGIKSGKSSVTANVTRLFSLPALRIAASILILIQTGVFTYQQFYIAGSIKELNQATQNQKIHSDNPGLVNKECIEESKKIITDVLGYDDPDFERKAIKYGKNLSSEEIENYAVQICQYSYRIQKTRNQQQKKELLVNILSNELNIRL